MFYSGLVVTSKPGCLAELLGQLRANPDIEVHQVDEKTGRIVVVLEKETIGEEEDCFRQIRELPIVVDVSLVVHQEDDSN